ncbi:restriction endonuclease subunit S [Nitrosomonas sp.]|uniref:restriction endonuclease subunit S n=1 Tax=Nitrosomonas sp. TaxID=42353 RepID=UPI002629800D|nr:restriction endonuclease subunit S [Nitrosomonas sp.]MCW5602053.1 restriction endonuclease subunit S [Nitrosomonas sp.]
MSFPRYERYKDSGVEWLGEVPAHWEVWKLPHAFRLIGSGTTPKSDNLAYYENGSIAWLNTGDLNDGELFDCEKRITELAMKDHSSLKLYRAGAMVIAMYGATIGKLAMLRFPATVNQACCVFSESSQIVSKFMFYWFLGLRQQIVSLATGGGQPNISQDILRGLRVACPRIEEQSTIAAFLDRETAKIDELIAEQQQLIELLKEKRQAVISHAVTKGLDPDVPMKDSGIEWLGEVPAHWELKRLKHCFRLLTEKTNRRENPVALENVESWSGRFIKTETVYEGDGVAFERGDILFGKLRPYLAKVYLTENKGEAIGDFHVLHPKGATYSRFSQYQILNREFIDVVDGSTFGAKMPRVSWDFLGNIILTVPPFSEQQTIASFLDRETTKVDELIAEAQRAITLLQERRTALISAAVTGKIDVRGLVSDERVVE